MKTAFLLAALSGSLWASQATAQQTFPAHVDMPIGAHLGAVQPANNDGLTVEDKASPEVLAEIGVQARTAQPSDVSAQVTEVAESDPTERLFVNTPVFDSPQMRALYPPLSRAGRMTAPREGLVGR